jgi:mono/diheme cytochrome c family protein
MRYTNFSIFTALAVLSVAACSGNRPSDDSAGVPTPADTSGRGLPDVSARPDTAAPRSDTAAVRTDTAAVQSDTAPAYGNPAAPGDTAQQIAMGDTIFNSKVGGKNCQSCHGKDAKGTNMAPDLTDDKWLHGDGSLEFIKQIVTNGVSSPKKHSSSMPSFKNVLTDEQINAVAAYVRSRSQPQRAS